MILSRLSRYAALQRLHGSVSCRFGHNLNIEAANVLHLRDKEIIVNKDNEVEFANGAANCRFGGTVVRVTAVANAKPGPAQSFLPLVVDYRLNYAATGRIPTNYLRRETGPSEREILSARLIDRCLRPLFPKHFRTETQLVCNTLSMDGQHLPDVLAINAASAALAISDIHWDGPVAAVRVGLRGDKVLINPTRQELKSSQLDLIVCVSELRKVVMLEGKGDSVSPAKLMAAISEATHAAERIQTRIIRLRETHGKPKQAVEPPPQAEPEVAEAVRSMAEIRLRDVFQNTGHDKLSRDQAVDAIRTNVIDKVWSSYPDTDKSLINEEFNKTCRQIFRELIFETSRRCDGRDCNRLRNIDCSVNWNSTVPGSAKFKRGQTQVLCTVSLDSIASALKLDTMSALDSGTKSKNFMLHYQFPPYATGEVGRISGVNRRELGHGALAERALLPVLPNDYPFTIRLTSEVVASNGSSSMATVCGGSLALMDAGVPVTDAVAGVAIGLVTKCDDFNHIIDYHLLTDILGIEDYMGDMDMKVAGTAQGLTAIQLDLKIPGLPVHMIEEALQKATIAQRNILELMRQQIAKPRVDVKDCCPVSETLTIKPYQRARFVGPGGINLKRLEDETGVVLTAQDEKTFTVFAHNAMAMKEGKEIIEELLNQSREPEEFRIGDIYEAQITEILDRGILVTLYPNMPPAFVPNNQLDARQIQHPSVLNFEVGQTIHVKYFGRDEYNGSMKLSRKALQATIGTVHKLRK